MRSGPNPRPTSCRTPCCAPSKTAAASARVARRGTGVNGEYELLLDIRTFESDYAGGATPSADVEIVAKLIANRGNTVVATRMLKQRAPAASTKVGDVSRAFDAALSAVVQDLVGWALVEGAEVRQGASRRRCHPIKR